jgi:hypothetical protein
MSGEEKNKRSVYKELQNMYKRIYGGLFRRITSHYSRKEEKILVGNKTALLLKNKRNIEQTT